MLKLMIMCLFNVYDENTFVVCVDLYKLPSVSYILILCFLCIHVNVHVYTCACIYTWTCTCIYTYWCPCKFSCSQNTPTQGHAHGHCSCSGSYSHACVQIHVDSYVENHVGINVCLSWCWCWCRGLGGGFVFHECDKKLSIVGSHILCRLGLLWWLMVSPTGFVVEVDGYVDENVGVVMYTNVKPHEMFGVMCRRQC